MNIVLTTIILFVVFGVLLFMGVPISVSIIVSSIVTAMSTLSRAKWSNAIAVVISKNDGRIRSIASRWLLTNATTASSEIISPLTRMPVTS